MEQSSDVVSLLKAETLVLLGIVSLMILVCIVYIIYHASKDRDRDYEFVHREAVLVSQAINCPMDSPRIHAMEQSICEDCNIDFDAYKRYKSRKELLTNGRVGKAKFEGT